MKRWPRSRREKRRVAFSLVEVILALAVVSFCLTVVIGLLSVGLIGVKNSTQQSAGGIVLDQIAIDIRNAASTNAATPSVYYGLGICKNLCWTNGGTGLTNNYTALSLGGAISTTNQWLVAHVQVYPAPSASSTGAALISVAWPPQAQWNTGTTNWNNAQGSISSYLIFVPRP